MEDKAVKWRMGQDLYAEYPFIRDYYKSLEADFPLKNSPFKVI